MQRLLLILVASYALAQNWPGSYTGAELSLQLRPDLSGSLVFEGQTYPVTARANGANLSGTFSVNGKSFPFTATLEGDVMSLSSGGNAYRLERAAAAGPGPQQATRAQSNLFTHSSGFTATLPAGWTAQEQTEGVLLLPPGASFNPQSPNNPEAYVLTAQDDYNPQEEASVVAQLSASITQSGGSGGQRQVLRYGNRSGALYRWDLKNPNTGQPVGLDIYLASEGTLVYLLLAVGEPSRIRPQEGSLRAILTSAAPPKAPPPLAAGELADNTPLAQRWLAKLRGKMVRQFWASQGMSFNKTHWLNADGTYRFKSSSMVSVDVPGASASSIGRGDETGRWRIRDLGGQVVLEVRYDNGNTVQMRIREEAMNWYLNGDKAFAVDPQ